MVKEINDLAKTFHCMAIAKSLDKLAVLERELREKANFANFLRFIRRIRKFAAFALRFF